MTTRRNLVLSATLLAAPAIPRAQPAWPSGPIRIIVPFPPGGSVDTIARLLQPHLQADLGVPIIVENRPGASGSLGAAQVARAAPDGQTFLHVFDTLVVNPALIPNIGFDTQRDLAPVLRIGTAGMTITTHRSRPWRSFQEVVAAAKARPDTITFGSIGNGSLAHLTMMLLQRAAGITLVHVPYRGGGPLVVAATAGEVDLPTATGTVFTQLFEQGVLRPLATTGPSRKAALREVPTLKELGFPVEAEAFWGALAPGGTPSPIITRYEAALRAAMAVPAVRERLVGVMGVDLEMQSGPDFAAFIAQQMAVWGRVVRENSIRPD
ncbi:MAG: tripartite tricarboxylate transporter substrate binding protein [Acetobacteraceae bacterium]|nr:tripartite tricarboxylate transporter substrate binding protein [Acetobacteraceae bacterium]